LVCIAKPFCIVKLYPVKIHGLQLVLVKGCPLPELQIEVLSLCVKASVEISKLGKEDLVHQLTLLGGWLEEFEDEQLLKDLAPRCITSLCHFIN
jgi:hypothetical protein